MKKPPSFKRRSIRLRGYDYSLGGAYFFTVVTQNRNSFFGEIRDRKMVLNEAGLMVQSVWDELTNHHPGILTDAFVLMPNHVHGIIVLTHGDSNRKGIGQPRGVAPTKEITLPAVIHRFKSMTTSRYRLGVKEKGWTPFPERLWQRNYFERVIRNQKELDRIREYIFYNPSQWETDRENPAANSVDRKKILEPWEIENQFLK